MSFAGVRGAITLAGVLTLPLTLNDGTPFPARDLAIFLAAGVIIVSLLAASIALPLLLRGLTMPSEPSKQVEEDRARVAAAKAAIREVERVQHALADGRGDADVYASAGTRIMDTYRERIERRTKRGEAAAQARRDGRIERDLRLAALGAERDEIFRIARDREIGSETAKKLIREIDLAEARHRV
jgi:CPA1 family monovalent cation:H+ antiporter